MKMENGINTPSKTNEFSKPEYSYDLFIKMDEKEASALVNRAFEEFGKTKDEANKDGKIFLALAARDGHPSPYVTNLAKTKFWESQKSFCYQVLHEKYPTYSAKYDDMMQSIATDFFEKLHKYDPYKGAPGTYFKFYIIHAAYKFVAALYPMVPEHRFPAFKALQAAADKLEQENKPITSEELHTLCPEIGMNTIKAFMPRLGADAFVSIDELGDSASIDRSVQQPIETPEEAVIKKEKRAAIIKGFKDAFTPEEFQVLATYYTTGGEKLTKTIEILNASGFDPESIGIAACFEDNIWSIINGAKSKLEIAAMELPSNDHFRAIIDRATKNKDTASYAQHIVNTGDECEEIMQLWVATTEDYIEVRRSTKPANDNQQIDGQMIMSFAVPEGKDIRSDLIFREMERHKQAIASIVNDHTPIDPDPTDYRNII